MEEILLLQKQTIHIRSDMPLPELIKMHTSKTCSILNEMELQFFVANDTKFLPTKDEPVNAFNRLLRAHMYEDPFKLEYMVQMDMYKDSFIYICVDSEGHVIDVFEIDEIPGEDGICARHVYSTSQETEGPSAYLKKLLKWPNEFLSEG
jgi:hypothetical protein